MKKLFTLFACLLAVGTVLAQAPDMFNYQAVARDASGNILANESINVTFIIHSGSAGGTVVFEEDHTGISTNDFGLFNLQIGGGSNVSGSIDGINWGTNSYWLEVEVNGASAGTQQFASVPYAKEAGGPWSRSGNNLNYEDGKVFVGRSSGVSGNEYFGVRTSTGSGVYGGMYIETEASDGRPFYGYATNGGSNTWTYLEGSTGNWFLYNNGQRMVVTPDGTYGFETNDPRYDMHLVHQTGSGSVNPGYGLLLENTDVNNHDWAFYVVNASGELWLFKDDQNVGRFSTTGAYSTASDKRLKENVTAMDGTLGRVMELNPVTYKFTHQESNANQSIGLIAQEAAPVFPELVNKSSGDHETEDPTYTVDYSGFSIVAIKAIQEQQQMIESMKKEIDALKKEIEEMK